MDAPAPAFTPPPGPPARALRFGPGGRFELQPVPYRLLVDGEPAALGGRALDLLFALASRPSALFGKNELIRRVWPGLVVEENNLRVQINGLRKVLGGDLIVTVPGRGYRLAVPDPGVDASTALATAPGAAPAATPRADPDPLFGRTADVAQVHALLQPGACVTVVGPPGVGKTRLARHLAAGVPDAGATWVDLTPYRDAEPLAGIVLRALDREAGSADPLPLLRRSLAERPRLLVLDNAEHRAAACAALLADIGPLPALRVLVTAQVPLGLRGECLHRLEPLRVASDPEDPAAGDDAAALLAHRIAALDPRFEPKPAVRRLLVRVCEQLDGLPLALEMAAARVPTLGLQGVHDALAQRFSLLTRGHRRAEARHVSLHEALDWSYQLLRPEEQALLRALSVFPAGFTLELAVAMAVGLARPEADDGPVGDDDPARWDAIDHLSTLVERSLVQLQEADGQTRYRLLESLRSFAARRLAERPAEQAAVLRQRARVFAGFFKSRNDRDWQVMTPVVAELPNAVHALAWAREHDLALAARLSAGAMPFAAGSVWRQAWSEAMRQLRPAMASAAAAPLPDALRADWWTEFARAMTHAGDMAAAVQAAQQALPLWETLGDICGGVNAAVLWVDALREPGEELDRAFEAVSHWTARALRDPTPRTAHYGGLLARSRAWAAHLRGDHEAEYDARVAEGAVARGFGHDRWAEAADCNAVNALLSLGRWAEAEQRARALLARVEAAGGDDNPNLPWVLIPLIRALAEQGQGEAARQLVPRAWAAAERMGTLNLLPVLPGVAQALGRWEAVALVVGHVRRAHEVLGRALVPMEVQLLQRAFDAAAAQLGERRAQGLAQEGRGLGDEAVLALFAAAD